MGGRGREGGRKREREKGREVRASQSFPACRPLYFFTVLSGHIKSQGRGEAVLTTGGAASLCKVWCDPRLDHQARGDMTGEGGQEGPSPALPLTQVWCRKLNVIQLRGSTSSRCLISKRQKPLRNGSVTAERIFSGSVVATCRGTLPREKVCAAPLRSPDTTLCCVLRWSRRRRETQRRLLVSTATLRQEQHMWLASGYWYFKRPKEQGCVFNGKELQIMVLMKSAADGNDLITSYSISAGKNWVEWNSALDDWKQAVVNIMKLDETDALNEAKRIRMKSSFFISLL